MTGPSSSARVANQAFAGGATRAGERTVPEECPVAFTYGRQTHAVMLATPQDLEDFAVGFSLAEEIVENPADITGLETVVGDLGIELRMDLRGERLENYDRRRRSLAGATGCGLCGLESLAEVARPAPPVGGDLTVSPAMIAAAMAALASAQVLNRETRAVHAAGFWTPAAGLVALREDVGRHNAMDKLAGALARRQLRGADGVVVLTSRVSLEMVQKTARLGATILVAVSAPTALAIRTAENCGLTLIAIARGEDFEIFTHPERVAVAKARHAVERLVTMANQIGTFFVSQRGGDAEKRIADHLRQFWDPRMRDAIIAHAAKGGAGLDPAVLRAVQLLTATP